jgi:hypothetical protein
MASRSLDELAAAFCACTLPRDEWTHAAHLRVGAWHVHQHGAAEALALLRTRIRRLNEHHGTENTATGGYHETITAANVRLIEEFVATFARDVPLETRVDALLAGALGERSMLLRFWSKEVLGSPRARAEWVDPDVRALSLT